MSVRPATPDDVDALVAFGEEVLLPHYTPILGTEGARGQLAWWTPELTTHAIEAGRIQVAEVDGELVGMTQTGEFQGEQVIWKLYLAPRFRGHALGPQLIRAAVETLPAGTGHVLLEHFAGNTRAGDFYEREGFRVIREEPSPNGDPAAAVVWRRRDL